MVRLCRRPCVDLGRHNIVVMSVAVLCFVQTSLLGYCDAFAPPCSRTLPRALRFNSRPPRRRRRTRSPLYHLDDRTTKTSTKLHMDMIPLSNELSSLSSSLSLSLYDSPEYLFMLPTATVVSTSCQLAGIGGAALFSPIFLLVFPVLHYDLPASPAQAVASALLTEVFGFASGLSGYARRGLVDWSLARQFMVVSVPAALVGALTAQSLARDVVLLRVLYAMLMLGLATFLTFTPRPEDMIETMMMDEECLLLDDDEVGSTGNKGIRSITAADGTVYTYLIEPSSSNNNGTTTTASTTTQGIGATVVGSALTGLLGVGVGEVILPQLVRGRCMPLPVAAGTSVAVVVVTALTAAVVQFLSLALSLSSSSADGGSSMSLSAALGSVVPWDLVQYTIPGVLIGGQLAPLLASRGQFTDEQIERFAATLFAIVGVAFAIKAVKG